MEFLFVKRLKKQGRDDTKVATWTGEESVLLAYIRIADGAN